MQINSLNKYISSSPVDTINAGSIFASSLKQGDIVCLYGELGSGKTQFVKGICYALGVEEPVNSPTFMIVNEYISDKFGKIYHFDLYRLRSKEEVLELGFMDYVNENMLILIEWPEIIEDIIPADAKRVHLSHTFRNENERAVHYK